MMAKTIVFKKAHTVNGIEYKKGDTLSVSSSIFALLTEDKTAGEKKPAVKKATTKKVISAKSEEEN